MSHSEAKILQFEPRPNKPLVEGEPDFKHPTDGPATVLPIGEGAKALLNRTPNETDRMREKAAETQKQLEALQNTRRELAEELQRLKDKLKSLKKEAGHTPEEILRAETSISGTKKSIDGIDSAIRILAVEAATITIEIEDGAAPEAR
jgi:chromosome segregation ATPase